MGITIHYSGKLDDPRVLPELLLAAEHFCFQHKWKYDRIDERIIGMVERWVPSDGEVQTITAPIDDTLRGIIIHPHRESESVFLTFNQHSELRFYMPERTPGRYWEQTLFFTKTQFAPLDIHISICELLHLIQDKYFQNLRVVDEGEYFETRDPARLAQNIGTLNAVMDRIESALNNPDADNPIAGEIQRAVDEAENAAGKKRKRKKKGLKVERGAKITIRDPEWKRGHGSSAGKN